MNRASSIAACLSLTLAACTSTILPPPRPDDPVQVFLLEEALHVGVVLPPDPDGAAAGDDDGEYVEFGYGDWSFYAEGNTGSSSSALAVLWPTQGALGRRTFGARTAQELRRRAHWVELSPITVSRAKATALRRRLQARFDDARAAVVHRPELRFRFVPYDAYYSLFWTCADEAAAWFGELDCDYWWCPVRIGLSVEAP